MPRLLFFFLGACQLGSHRTNVGPPCYHAIAVRRDSLLLLMKLGHGTMAYLMDLSGNYFALKPVSNGSEIKLDIRFFTQDSSLPYTGTDQHLYDLVNWLRLAANWIASVTPTPPEGFSVSPSLQFEPIEKARRVRAIRISYQAPSEESASVMEISPDANDVRVFANEIQREVTEASAAHGSD